MIERLISPLGTSNTESKIPKGEDIKDLLKKLLKDLYAGISNLRFGPDPEENLFQSS